VILNLAIGQGELLATPLQMARAFAAIGGDGYLYRPQTVLVSESAYGNRDVRRVVRSQHPVCSPRTRRFLQRALRGVVSQEHGTGGLARVAGVEISGKTGTAENSSGEDHAWFVAYAPSRDPDVSVALIVENAGHGGEIAAPLVRQVLDAYFHLRRHEAMPPLEETR
jgi:penicillin-binding protein 2